MKKSAFTLIELLVVIAIIAILAAILFPVFAQAKGAAQRTACISNMKQLATSIVMYGSDFDDLMPLLPNGAGAAGLTGGWIYYSRFPAGDGNSPKAYDPSKGSLYPYIRSTQIFTCPTDSVGKTSGNSYSMNACVAQGGGALKFGKSQSAFEEPSNMMMMNEEADVDAGRDSTDDGYFLYPGNNISTRHALGSDNTFIDTHAKFLRPSDAIARGIIFGSSDLSSCP